MAAQFPDAIWDGNEQEDYTDGSSDAQLAQASDYNEMADEVIALQNLLKGLIPAGAGGIGIDGQAYSQANDLVDGATIDTDCDDGNVHDVTLAGDRTLANPTNMKDGATYCWIVRQDGVGGHTLAFGAAFKWPGGSAPTISAGIGAVDVITAICDGSNLYCAIQQDFG